MPPTTDPDDAEYGISHISRQLLVFSYFLFVLGGLFSIFGVSSNVPIHTYFGVGTSILGVAVYTLTVMFTTIHGPPTAIHLKGCEAISRVKPATFHQAPQSQILYVISFILFSAGFILVIIGFKRGSSFLWIPGYSLSMAGFLTNTITIMYGPLNVKPGAVVVTYPNECNQQYVVDAMDAEGVQNLRRDSMMDVPRYVSGTATAIVPTRSYGEVIEGSRAPNEDRYQYPIRGADRRYRGAATDVPVLGGVLAYPWNAAQVRGMAPSYSAPTLRGAPYLRKM